jgi:hypothetical protein
MVSLLQLWAPILLSAFLVFVSSSLIHMVLKWHNSDYRRLPNEDEIRAAFRKGNPAPGQYITPWCMDAKDMNSPEVTKKYEEGPIGLFYLSKPGRINMGPTLGKWFAFNILVSVFIAYVASRTLPIGTEYLKVFQVVGTVGLLTYAGGEIPSSIWYGKPWAVTGKQVVDSLIYGMVTAGTFGWLWPR